MFRDFFVNQRFTPAFPPLLFQDTKHPCTANNPEGCTSSLSPQDFIDLFNF